MRSVGTALISAISPEAAQVRAKLVEGGVTEIKGTNIKG